MSGITTNLNVSPFFDDFDESKNFHRILFRPGMAVQSRELTQLQTILQNQVSRFGDHIFKEGSLVIGTGLTLNKTANSIKLHNTFNGTAATYNGLYIRGVTSNAYAKVITTSETVNDITEPATLYVKSLNGNAFINNEVLQNANTLVSFANTAHTGAHNSCMIASTDESIYFTHGNFVRADKSTIIVDKYSANTSYLIGFNVIEKTVASSDDSTLLDPAAGSYNYTAPGADRLNITLQLAKKGLSDDVTNFIQMMKVVGGTLTDRIAIPVYSVIEDTLARRTYDESGSYTVRPYPVHFRAHLAGNAAKLTLGIEPGKSYVKGHEMENISTQYMDIDKPRTSISINNAAIQGGYSNYCYVDTITGDWVPDSFTVVELHNNTTVGAATKIGTAKVRNIIYDSAGPVYRMYLFDIAYTGASNFNAVRSVIVGTYSSYSAKANINTSLGIVSSNAQLIETNRNSLVFPLVASTVKTLRSSDGVTVDTRVRYRKSWTAQSFVAGSKTITLTDPNTSWAGGTGALSIGIRQANYYVVATSTSGTFTTGQVIDMSTGGRSITVSGLTATFNLNDATFAGTCSIYATIDDNIMEERTKTCVFFQTKAFNTPNTVVGALDDLNTSDIYRLRSVYSSANTGVAAVAPSITFAVDVNAVIAPNYTIRGVTSGATATVVSYSSGSKTAVICAKTGSFSNTEYVYIYNTLGVQTYNVQGAGGIAPFGALLTAVTAGDTDVTANYKLDDGQRDSLYDHGGIQLTGSAPAGRLLVYFDYFTHSGSGYFSVDSYTSSGITYETIPTFTSPTTGKKVELRDVMDFRPRKADGASTIAANIIPEPDYVMSVDYFRYLPRTDVLWIDATGQFGITTGIPSLTPVAPFIAEGDKMPLYRLIMPAYVLSIDDTTVQYIDNERYTMKDIGNLARRVERLEYYTALNVLEKNAQDLQVKDGSGNNRYKNGILVDQFTGHSVGDVNNPDYKCSVDFNNNYMTTPFTPYNIPLSYDNVNSTSIQQTGDVLTLPYTTTQYINQDKASRSVNINPYDVISWVGTMAINPPSDQWVDTSQRPDVIVDASGDAAAWSSVQNTLNNGMAQGWGTQWGDWNVLSTRRISGNENTNPDIFAGRFAGQGLATVTTQTRTGIATQADIQRKSFDLGTRVTDVSIVPYIRSRTLTVTAAGMKPHTVVYPFFDNINVSSYCSPSVLQTDAAGSITMTFTIPSSDTLKFRTGERLFRLIDTLDNEIANASTYSSFTYAASGFIQTQENTNLIMRTIERGQQVTTTSTVNSATDIVVTGTDPTAQTFFVNAAQYPNGMFISDIDVFFKTKSSSIPVMLQIRPTTNGYPHATNVFPFGTVVKQAVDVNTSIDGSVATTFTLPAPLYLSPGEYAIVLLTNTQEYEVFVAQMGKVDLISNQTISTQPYIGSLFQSQNASTWSADQTLDLKMVVRKCVFNINGTHQVILNNTAPASTEYINLVRPSIQDMQVSGANIGYSYKATLAGGALASSWTPASNKTDIYLDNQYQVTAGSNGSLIFSADFTSSSSDVSPCIDTKLIDAIGIKFLINNDSTNEGGKVIGGNATAKYITKTVTLADGFDATDLRLMMNSYVPLEGTIEIYYKVLSGSDPQTIDQKSWTGPMYQVNQTGTISDSRDQWYDLEFKSSSAAVPSISYSDGTTTYSNFKKFAIKIVMKSSNTGKAPMISQLRAIALA